MAESIHELQVEIFKALSHPARIRILNALRERKRCACNLAPELGIEQSNFSRHISVLKNAGLIRCWKEGVSVFFTLADQRVIDLLDNANEILKHRIQLHHRIVV
ncbi:MAG: metalloregulator ArsR/SmtB family transcription factor [candidate division KSB1 bacterium]|nr:metalloregulator ArsR/SmtB family transcription factor [candidate division KSB1 bacterium]